MIPRPRAERGAFFVDPLRYGSSHLGLPLEVWMPVRGATRTLVIAGVHGEEPETTVLVSRALRSLTGWPRDCAVVVCANPDGAMRGSRGNGRGVDLNRNFPAANWRSLPVTHRWRVEDESDVLLGPGLSPGSEPETQALLRLIENLKPKQVIAVHAPLACIDDPANTAAGRWLSERTDLPLVEDIGYPTPGSMGSWARERKLPWITFELPRRSVEELVDRFLPVCVEIMQGGAPT